MKLAAVLWKLIDREFDKVLIVFLILAFMALHEDHAVRGANIDEATLSWSRETVTGLIGILAGMITGQLRHRPDDKPGIPVPADTPSNVTTITTTATTPAPEH